MTLRSIRMSDDIWEELMRLRHDGVFGEQKSWDTLLNYFLICHHNNGDWRMKVQAVDANPEYVKELNDAIDLYLVDNDIISDEKLRETKSKIYDRYYKDFVKGQHEMIEHERGIDKAGIKVKTHKIKKGGNIVGSRWRCGKCNTNIETDSPGVPPCNCEV